MKRAIIAAGFGTTIPSAIESDIRPVEDALAAAFPDRKVVRAFTSQAVIDRLKSREMDVPDVSQAVDLLRSEGIHDIAVVSTHIIPGTEYNRLLKTAGALPVSRPLLYSDDDLRRMAALLGSIAEEEGCMLLAAGHGSGHIADEIYARLNSMLDENVRLACLMGRISLESILPALKAFPEKRIVLMPLMLTSGMHARKHLADADQSSWKSMLEAEGFEVRLRPEGLGSMDAVRQMFIEKAKEII